MGTRLRPGKLSCDVRNRPLPSDARHARRQGPPRHLMHSLYASWIFRDGSIAGLSPPPLGSDRNVLAGRRDALSSGSRRRLATLVAPIARVPIERTEADESGVARRSSQK